MMVGCVVWWYEDTAPSLPRVVAIIAEALAVEVLPPDHAARARLVGIVKQIQVPNTRLHCHLLGAPSSPPTPHPLPRGTGRCSRRAWRASRSPRSWRCGRRSDEAEVLDRIRNIFDHFNKSRRQSKTSPQVP